MSIVKLLLATTLLSGCSVVGPGERGVRISLGKLSNDALEPGAYLWIPALYGTAKVNVQIQKSEVVTKAASSDMQDITTHVAVNWSVNPEKTVEMYRTVGDETDIYERIIKPAVSEVMKSAISQMTAEGVLSKRLILKEKIDVGLKDRLAHYGVNLYDVSIINFEFSQEFHNAIEAKQVAEQRAQQAKYEADKATQDANAEINRAKGQAEAQRLQKQTITADLIQLKAIEKWNGVLPATMTGNTVPFISLGK